MAFDACMMRATLAEFSQEFPDAKIEKVLEPQNDEIDLVIHGARISRRLVFNVGPNAPRLQLSDIAKENPLKAPSFCMFMRKHLTGARIIGVSQPGFDRIAEFKLSVYDEMGFITEKKLVCEIMGKYANLIFLDSDDKIISALKMIDFSASTVRQVLPGLKYRLPDKADKLSPLEIDRDSFFDKLKWFPIERTGEKFITSTYSGIATQIARELVYRATGMTEVSVGDIDPEKFWEVFSSWQRLLIDGDYNPTVVIDKDGKPIDYSYMDITYLGDEVEKRHYATLRELFDHYFAEKDRVERIRQRAHDLITLLNNATARTERKLAIQREALRDSERGEEYKRQADLITSNIYRIERGMTSFSCIDYYDENCPEVTIALDSRLNPSSNAQRFYKLYNKAKNAKIVLTEQIKTWEKELLYLESVRSFLDKAQTEEDLSELREELYRSGYSAKMKNYRPQKKIRLKPREFVTSGGYTILVGRNNIQNDYLTFKIASKDDIWFHVKDMPGSHLVMLTEGREPDASDYTEAAEAAAYYSTATTGPVAVDYTAVRNVKKPAGSKPGFVIYKTNFTAFVNPNAPKGE